MAAMNTREAYDAICDAIIALATGRVASFQLGSKSVTYLDIDKLRSLKAELAVELCAEDSDPSHLTGAAVAYFERW